VKAPAPGAVAELVRLPAVLSVPGDVLLGAAASGQGRDVPRSAGLAAASSCLYLAGMALNDYADREVDAVERPTRPIPSGRVTPGFALGLATGLTAAAAGIAVAADGTRALGVLAPLAACVWAYDLVLKQTPAGPASMAACRGLDVLMGSGPHGAAKALPQAAVVTAHIGVTTTVSQREVQGAHGVEPLAAGGIVEGAVHILPGALDLSNHRQTQVHQLTTEVGHNYQSGAGVCWVGDATHVTRSFELVHDRANGLLADLCGFSQLAEPGPVRCDALEHPRLAQRKVVSVRLEVGEHSGLHRPVRDEQQKPEVQRL